MEPVGTCRAAASPAQPACGMTGRMYGLQDSGEQAPDLRDGQRDQPAQTSAAAVHLIAAEETVRVAYAMLAWLE